MIPVDLFVGVAAIAAGVIISICSICVSSAINDILRSVDQATDETAALTKMMRAAELRERGVRH
jgi:hypothetical protein